MHLGEAHDVVSFASFISARRTGFVVNCGHQAGCTRNMIESLQHLAIVDILLMKLTKGLRDGKAALYSDSMKGFVARLLSLYEYDPAVYEVFNLATKHFYRQVSPCFAKVPLKSPRLKDDSPRCVCIQTILRIKPHHKQDPYG